jgi:hypothetical protein
MVNKELADIRQEWTRRYQQFDRQLAEAVSRIDVDNKGLAALRTRLPQLPGRSLARGLASSQPDPLRKDRALLSPGVADGWQRMLQP